MAGLIAMARDREIPSGSKVLYVHLGGAPFDGEWWLLEIKPPSYHSKFRRQTPARRGSLSALSATP